MNTAKIPLLFPEWISTDPPYLLGGRCEACGALRFPVARVCARCQSEQISTVPLSTVGVIYSHTVVRASPPGYAGEVPYGLGIVELPEGIRIEATLTADDLNKLAIGDVASFELIQLGRGEHAVTSFAYRHGGVQR